MSLYPTLEDMQVDHMAQAQAQHVQQIQNAIQAPESQGQPPAYGAVSMPPAASTGGGVLYPSLVEYMGLDFQDPALQQQVATYAPQGQVAVPSYQSNVVAPVTGDQNKGVVRAEIKQGLRQIICCKDNDGKIGLRVKSVNKGIFVAFVHRESPASLAGLRFGDQILQINGENVAGWDSDKCMNFLKKASGERITFAVRDRPFERTITMQKDSTGHVGFVFKENKITHIVKDTSAARNGVLIDHHLVEVNGQNVVGLKEKDIKAIIDGVDRTVTITVIPTVIYEHIVKSMGSGLIKKFMDHSVPDA